MFAAVLDFITSKTARYVVIGLLIAAAVGYVLWLRKEVHSTHNELVKAMSALSAALEVNEANVEEIARIRKNEQAARSAIVRVERLADKRAQQVADIRKTFVGDVDVVCKNGVGSNTRAAIDGLRAAAASDNENPDSNVNNPSGVAGGQTITGGSK